MSQQTVDMQSSATPTAPLEKQSSSAYDPIPKYGDFAPIPGTGTDTTAGARKPPNQYHDGAQREIEAEAGYYRDILFDLFKAVRRGDDQLRQKCLVMLRGRKPAAQIRDYLGGMLAVAGLSDLNEKIVNASYATAIEQAEMENKTPTSRPKVVDIQALRNNLPYRVPAKPWTTVTDSDDLVSHLVALYLTWGYPFYAFFCRETFVQHMRMGNLNSDFCSPFLVNALLANACFYSDYPEALQLPGDIRAYGVHFLAEAEWYLRSYQFESGSDLRLTSLQATLLLYERYSLSGRDDFGYTMLHRAIKMGESIGLVNNNRKLKLEAPYNTPDMIRSLKRTAWGLFQVDTLVHIGFLKESHIKRVNVDRLERYETPDDEMWIPYPIIQGRMRKSLMSVYFDEACKLSYISRDISWCLTQAKDRVNLKQELYARLRQWEEERPKEFDVGQEPAPYIYILRMRYHSVVIILCCHNLDMSSIKTNADTPDLTESNSDAAAVKAALTSARAIASLAHEYQRQYELPYAHQFMMYALNISLFCMIVQEDFDVLNPEFLSLTSAFSTLASHSQVGRHLFRAFKLSVQSRLRNGQTKRTENLPPVIVELFAPREDNNKPDTWDRYAEGLAAEEGEKSFLANIDLDPAVPELQDMLSWYEKLSIGKEIQWTRSGKKLDF